MYGARVEKENKTPLCVGNYYHSSRNICSSMRYTAAEF